MRTVIECRSRMIINDDPQRRCYNGVHFSTKEIWGEWECLEHVKPEEIESRLKFWQELNDYAVSQRGQGAKREFRIRSATFYTHKGEAITGERLQWALDRVAEDWKALAYAIRKEDAYGSHVTEEMKEAYLQAMLAEAEDIRKGEKSLNFTFWQRVNAELTGECIAFLPK